uniref:DnaJ-class molecular chaperone with C-terminal Zn finger domain n=1 Tax=uncultured marine thaumarchaeote SAT1000_06_A02 TaxID=1456359 RepID=A0A075I1C2_9ARCH|nr:DnaJ-class molecular chaperone with C-terminal Zn finger domain [uncultured marine thaumarchaeote SAT1000_06_A02]
MGVNENSSPKEMKNAYRKLSLKYHPDKTNIDQSDTKFKEVTEAYQFLKLHQKQVKKPLKMMLEVIMQIFGKNNMKNNMSMVLIIEKILGMNFT